MNKVLKVGMILVLAGIIGWAVTGCKKRYRDEQFMQLCKQENWSAAAQLIGNVDKSKPYIQEQLGEMYYNGKGVEKDYAEALKWHRKAAERGNAKAQAAIGGFYLGGIVVKKDTAEAVKWLRKAAEQGHIESLFSLWAIYRFGESVIKQDLDEAAKWYRKVEAQGNEDAIKLIKLLEMTGGKLPK